MSRFHCTGEPENTVVVAPWASAPVTVRCGKIDDACGIFGDVANTPVLLFESALLLQHTPAVQHDTDDAFTAQVSEEEVATKLRKSGAAIDMALAGAIAGVYSTSGDSIAARACPC